jgi:hypothetical protein
MDVQFKKCDALVKRMAKWLLASKASGVTLTSLGPWQGCALPDTPDGIKMLNFSLKFWLAKFGWPRLFLEHA